MEKKVLAFLQKEIDLKSIPGAAIYVSYEGKKILDDSIGFRTFSPQNKPVERNTIYDLASLTKVVATTPAILQLIDKGEIHLQDKIRRFFPEFNHAQITIEHLMTHTSGLPAHRPYHNEKLNFSQMSERISIEQLVHSPGNNVIYSDLGFILLTGLIEKVAGQPFEEFTKKKIFQRLNMNETGFNLPFEQARFAATEYSPGIGDYKYGIVHDENAESMGGVSGHAGLFSTIQDLAKFTTMIESGGFFNGQQIISNASISLSKRNYTPFASEGRGLGWQIKGTSCGDLFSQSSYGHTGFTGTSIWFDPTIQLHVILLTNKVHGENQEAILRLRPCIHNLIRSHF
ncbi:serine hydrolase domain-containing protein [Pseudogracilibacillus auburnensis]|uniref:serine hydrolase domain-containing protein n=1 Tax=Pseudogracilibacillus auburnensis TaxID=1494959 RepID=UPI001A967022|nr:serine hydrolase domain-containing protein [Pseudogracilibacillus auburnensis]MBO1005335.1 beta-lactamase family protein [Pseudogracilibacillus auburnensis]